jgi:hypothetical protein
MRISLLNDGIYDYQPDVITEPIRNIIDSTSNIKLMDELTVLYPQPTYLEPILTGGIKPQVTSLEPTLIGGAIATVATTPTNDILLNDNVVFPIMSDVQPVLSDVKPTQIETGGIKPSVGSSLIVEPELGLPSNPNLTIAPIKLPTSDVGAFMGSLENGEIEEPTSVTDVLKKEAKFPYWLIAVAVVGGYLVFKKK